MLKGLGRNRVLDAFDKLPSGSVREIPKPMKPTAEESRQPAERSTYKL
jgi:hypothetical protein